MSNQPIEKMILASDALRAMNLTDRQLHQLIENGKIRAAMLNGALLVSQNDLLSDLPRTERPEYKKYAHLAGISIGMGEASRKYGVSTVTIYRWVKKGLIRTIGKSSEHKQKVLVDEADVAYCVEVYHYNPGQGKRVFNPDGTPYKKK
jgi:hypothetical protein